MTETATAISPTDTPASSEASTTAAATAATLLDTTQQTQTAETPAAKATETPAAAALETKETPAAAVAPETYTFKAPEGTEFDPEVLESYSGAAKKAGLTQDAAQKLIEEMAPALAARQADQVQAIHQGWIEATKADPELGGDKLAENMAVAKKGLNFVNDPELNKLLEETGLGNNPSVIRAFFRVGKAISEDKFVGGSPAGSGTLNKANVLYDKTAQKG